MTELYFISLPMAIKGNKWLRAIIFCAENNNELPAIAIAIVRKLETIKSLRVYKRIKTKQFKEKDYRLQY